MARYLTETEEKTVGWFKAIQADAAKHCEAAKLDPFGILTLTLPPDPSEEAAAWLSLVKAQARSKNAIVNLAEHGCLVLILPRYAKAKQKTFGLES